MSGTVLDIEGAAAAVEAGATFLVMPVTDPDVIGWAVERGVPAFPGALSPTEVLTAWRSGASAVKLFPASAGGPTLVRELRGPFPDIPLMPTGGVTADNARSLIEAGAVAVGVGSWLAGAPDEATLRNARPRSWPPSQRLGDEAPGGATRCGRPGPGRDPRRAPAAWAASPSERSG